MRDIVVVGSLNVDVSLHAPHLPRPGETVRGGELMIGAGGKGLNQAIGAARLGARVHMVGALGEDRFRDVPQAALREAGVDESHVRDVGGEHTGTALIMVAEDGQNAIAVAGGANHAVSPEDVRDAVAAFRSSAVLLVQLELPLETVEAALDLARGCGLLSILDPAPVRELPGALLRKVSVITPNQHEAQFLTGVEIRDIESAAKAASLLQERTLGEVLVTLGEKGCVWAFSTGFEHIPAPRVRPIDTTAAGDAFNAALAVGLARGESLAVAVHEAVRVASASTLRRGAASSLPRSEEVEGLLAGTLR